MRIQNIASFYDASSRINSINRISRIQPESSSEVKSENAVEKNDDLSRASVGVKQTLVSSDNSYQKQMLSDPDFAMKRMAGKLMDKLPQIMEDISKLSPQDEMMAVDNISKETNKPSKVVINENSNVNYEGNAVNALQDISL